MPARVSDLRARGVVDADLAACTQALSQATAIVDSYVPVTVTRTVARLPEHMPLSPPASGVLSPPGVTLESGGHVAVIPQALVGTSRVMTYTVLTVERLVDGAVIAVALALLRQRGYTQSAIGGVSVTPQSVNEAIEEHVWSLL